MGFLGVRIDKDMEEAIKRTGRPASSVARDALRQYLELDRPPISPEHAYMIQEMERLLNEKLSVSSSSLNNVKQPQLNSVKQPSPQPVLNAVKQVAPSKDKRHQPPLNGVKRKDERLQNALRAILGFFDDGIEPLVGEVAEKAGDTPGGLGMILGKVGVRTQVTARGERRGRMYTFEMRPQIEKLLESDELEEVTDSTS